MPTRLTALAAAGLLTAACTSTPPLLLPTPAPPPPPEACLTPCPPLPPLHHDTEAAVLVWLHDLIDAAGACRRQHDNCRAAHPDHPDLPGGR